MNPGEWNHNGADSPMSSYSSYTNKVTTVFAHQFKTNHVDVSIENVNDKTAGNSNYNAKKSVLRATHLSQQIRPHHS